MVRCPCPACSAAWRRHPVGLVDPDHRADHRHLAALPAAEQVVDRDAELARLQVVERHVDPGLGPDPALERRGDARIGERALLDGRTDQCRRREAPDGADDLLGELLGLARGCGHDLGQPLEPGLVGAQAQQDRMVGPGGTLGDPERPQAGRRQRDGVDRRDLDPRRHQLVPGDGSSERYEASCASRNAVYSAPSIGRSVPRFLSMKVATIGDWIACLNTPCQ